MNQELTVDTVSEMMKASLAAINREDLAHLFATGKNELLLRDLLASYMHRTLKLEGEEFVAREWKKHDLAIVNGFEPIAIIEGKSWAHFDSINQHKLLRAEKSVERALLQDIQKMRVTTEGHPKCKKFISTILFSVEVARDFPLAYGQLTYGSGHKGGVKKMGSFEELVIAGRGNLQALYSQYGQIAVNSLEVGTFLNMKVAVDFIVLEVE